MLWKKKQAGVAGSLVLGIALLLSGGVSQAEEATLILDRAFVVTQPEMLEVTQPEFLEVTEPDRAEVTNLDSLTISKPKSLESGLFPKGKYTPAERDNPAYDRCAKQKGFDAQLECAREALGTTQE